MKFKAPSAFYSNIQFWRLCVSSFLFFTSFNMVIPELPGYLKSMGGEKYIGYIIFLFTITAGLSRPFSGKWADKIGRVPVMVVGAVVSAICGLAYAFVSGVFAFLLLRFLHGFSTGFTPTGTSAYVADIVPNNKRGEAMGVVSLSGSLGMAFGPALGSFIYADFGYDVMFYSSAAAGLIAFWAIAGIKETLPVKEKFTSSMFKIKWEDVYEKRVKSPAIVMVLMVISFGAMITLVPDLCEEIGLENKGYFFAAFTIASVSVRFFAGRFSDTIGRAKVLLFSSLLFSAAMVVIGFATDKNSLFLGAVMFGLAQGINSPTIMAWAIDLGDEKRIGRAMSTVYIALEIGIGTGAFFAGYFYALDHTNLPWIFVSCALLTLVSFAYLLRIVLLKRTA